MVQQQLSMRQPGIFLSRWGQTIRPQKLRQHNTRSMRAGPCFASISIGSIKLCRCDCRYSISSPSDTVGVNSHSRSVATWLRSRAHRRIGVTLLSGAEPSRVSTLLWHPQSSTTDGSVINWIIRFGTLSKIVRGNEMSIFLSSQSWIDCQTWCRWNKFFN